MEETVDDGGAMVTVLKAVRISEEIDTDAQ